MNITSIISNIAMIGNAIATIAVLLKGQSQMYQMNCNPAYGTPVMTPQMPNGYVTYPQPVNNQNNYGYGYAQPEPVQPCQPNPTPMNQVCQTPQPTQSYYNNQYYCAPVWSIDPSRNNIGYQPICVNPHNNDISFGYVYGIEQNSHPYEYNYNAYNYQSRRAYDGYMINHNPYPYNWPYHEPDMFNPNGITQHVNIQQPQSPWAKQSTVHGAIQNWNQNFLNNAPPDSAWSKYPQREWEDQWTRYAQQEWSRNNDAYRYGARL